MATTIKISEENKKKLFKLKADFEKSTGSRVSYDDIVGIILGKLENIQKKQLIEDLNSLKGILTQDDKDYFKKMRKVDKNREERFISN